ncbi:hypothetical protein [Primorskyibacter sp. S87]|uniref:hypothetical protein n=1 Tax=Primorskyibacter sp. S87 TaxID=3415126 RepID=UPI003C7CC352
MKLAPTQVLRTMGLTLALSSAPLSALATYGSRHDTTQLPNGIIEVISLKGPSAADYWCGAGQYAGAILGKPASTRIFVWRGRGPSSGGSTRPSVQFSLDPPPGGAVESMSNSVEIVGNQLSIAQAQNYCDERAVND